MSPVHLVIDPPALRHTHYGHFLHQQLPVVHALLRHHGLEHRHDLIFHHSKPHGQLLRLFTNLPVEPEPGPAGTLRLDVEALGSGWPRYGQDIQMPVRQLHLYLQARLPAPEHRHILVVVRAGFRRWADLESLIRTLRVLPWPVLAVDFAQKTLDEQIQLCRQARLIVGVHGAGLTNILFAPPGGALLEVRPYGTCEAKSIFPTLAADMELDYTSLPSRLNMTNHRLPYYCKSLIRKLPRNRLEQLSRSDACLHYRLLQGLIADPEPQALLAAVQVLLRRSSEIRKPQLPEPSRHIRTRFA